MKYWVPRQNLAISGLLANNYCKLILHIYLFEEIWIYLKMYVSINAVGNVDAHLFSSRYFLELKEKNASTH